jgi:hypothetical protein
MTPSIHTVLGLLSLLLVGVVLAADPPPAPPAPEKPAAPLITPAEWLKAQPKPAFRAGATLPRLTRFGWVLPLDTRIELTEHWGYALEFGGYVDMGVVARLDTPNSDEAKMAALVKADPKRYPVAVICSRRLPGTEAPPESWTRDQDGKVLNGKAQSMDGTEWSEGKGAVWSPEAPDAVWQLAGQYRADPLRELVKRGVPLSIVLNGGEYGLGVLGFAKPVWAKDPKIVDAVTAQFKGAWRDYASTKKAHAERIIADAVRAAVPKRDLYVYYTAGGGVLRNKDWAIDDWGAQWKHMRGVSDLPSNEIYYRHFNDGFTGRLNLLTIALNAVAAEIAVGDTLSYNWICGGWTRGDAEKYIADLERWTGFLKCYYTAGMLGANVGYYEYPTGGFGAKFPADAPPIWLRQMAASAHVHALFSQVEELVRQGDLLPGPMKHAISPADSAYEFPTGDETARVLVRKHRTKAEWLLTAWAADGPDRAVTVRVPELGRLTLQARVCGSVYRATLADGKVTRVQLDPAGSAYTQAEPGTPVTAPVDLAVDPPTRDGLLMWLAADAGVTKDDAGKVAAWKSEGAAGLILEQPDAARRPQWVADGLGGKAALRFEKGRQWLAVADAKEAGAAFTGPLTIFLVFTGTTPKGDNRILSAVAEKGADYINGQGVKVTDDGPAPTDPKDGLMIKGGSGELKSPLRTLVVGAMTHGGGIGGPGFTGALAEVLIYKGALSATRAALVTDYLRAKYGR